MDDVSSSHCQGSWSYDMDIELDPKEVLAHLKEMGYHNITQLQLQEFIKDLKKLILYDQQRLSTGRGSTRSSSSTSTSPEENGINQKRLPHKIHKPNCTRQRHESNGNADISSSSSNSNSQDNQISVQKQQTVSDTSKSLTAKDQRPVLKSRENLATQRPKSSFIRPRELTGQRPGSAPQKSDPVALYHYYKQLWKQQKLPGEEPHAELRWMVREKMLGQDSQPRCGCCCHCDCMPRNVFKREHRDINQSENPVIKNNNMQESLRIRGPYTLDGKVTGLKSGKIKERKVLGTFEIYDTVIKQEGFNKKRTSKTDLYNGLNIEDKSCCSGKLHKTSCECLVLNKPEERLCQCKINPAHNVRRSDDLKSRNKYVSPVWDHVDNLETNRNQNRSTLANHIKKLLLIEQNFTSDLIGRNKTKIPDYEFDREEGQEKRNDREKVEEIGSVEFKDKVKKGSYKIYKYSDEEFITEKLSDKAEVSLSDKNRHQVKQKQKECRHVTVCDCEDNVITFVTFKSDKSNGSKKIVISTEITKPK